MIQIPAELLSLSAEPLLIACNARILFANAAAEPLFDGDCVGKSVRRVLGDEIADTQAGTFAAEIELAGKRRLLRARSMEGYRLFSFGEEKLSEPGLSDAFLHALRCRLMELHAGAAALQAMLGGAPAAAERLNTISRSIFALNRILSNLSVVRDTMENTVFFQPRAMDLAAFLRHLTDAVRDLMKGPELLLDAPEQLPIQGDPEMLEALVLNLISNCLLHAEGCTRISLRILPTADRVILSVNDDGCGIAPEELYTVFDRYSHGFDLTNVGRGSGFGLTAVRKIAQLHGGTLLLESRPGHGTAVRVSLSRAPKPRLTVKSGSAFYENSCDRLLMGLADCLPASAFEGSGE